MTQFPRVKALLEDYLAKEKLPGYALLLSRQGREIGWLQGGDIDVEQGRAVDRDSIYRIYSMTKPITSVALMQLWEKGLFQLDDPVSRYISSWQDLKVYVAGDSENYQVKSPDQAMTIRHLLTHTSGLTYGFDRSHPIDQLYHHRQIYQPPADWTLAYTVEQLGAIPLRFSPGSRWNYSVATDVVGYLVELLSGQSLGDYIAANITGPLGMIDSGFFVNSEQLPRFAACYQHDKDSAGYVIADRPESSTYLDQPLRYSGGGGMLSTIDDYHLFARAMLNGGEYHGVQVLRSDTVELMTQNHLPANADLASLGQSSFCETSFAGVGFGLGYSVLMDPLRAGVRASIGEYAWGGMASTYHWVDPEQDLIVVFMTQLIPSDTWPIRAELKNLVYQDLADEL